MTNRSVGPALDSVTTNKGSYYERHLLGYLSAVELLKPRAARIGDAALVGSSAGAAARRLVLGLCPRFPSSCPFRICRGSVSSARHIARSVRISRTTRSCTFHDKADAPYQTGATAESDRP